MANRLKIFISDGEQQLKISLAKSPIDSDNFILIIQNNSFEFLFNIKISFWVVFEIQRYFSSVAKCLKIFIPEEKKTETGAR